MSALPGDAVIVALAGRRYAVERNWGRLPADVPPAMVSQVAVDRQGRVHYQALWSCLARTFRSPTSLRFLRQRSRNILQLGAVKILIHLHPRFASSACRITGGGRGEKSAALSIACDHRLWWCAADGGAKVPR
jgi:hypothetical protein